MTRRAAGACALLAACAAGPLAAAGGDEDAAARWLAAGGQGTEAHRWLGRAAARSRREAELLAGAQSIAPALRAALLAGVARGHFEHGRDDAGRAALERIDGASVRAEAVTSLLGAMFLDGDEVTAVRLLRAVGVPASAPAAQLATIADSLIAGGAPADGAEVAARIDDERVRDPMLARALLDAAPTTSRYWETVAMRLGREAWLESYYASIRDPWRRAERHYQLARRAQAAGDEARAARVAGLAEAAAADVTTPSTRWIVWEALASIHAGAGRIDAAREMAGRIPGDSRDGVRHRGEAQASIAAAHARAGDFPNARAVAGGIADLALRARGFAAAAEAAYPIDPDAYAAFVDAARAACLEVGGESCATPGDAWTALVARQARLGDAEGAAETAAVAGRAGVSAGLEWLVGHRLESGDYEGALRAARAISPGVDPRHGNDRRLEALASTVGAAAGAGRTDVAVPVLAEIDHDAVRERAAPAVARALFAAGDEAGGIALLRDLRRGDSRYDASAIALHAILRSGGVPDPVAVMGAVPERDGGELCWAAAAAIARDHQVAVVDAWLARLEHPSCRAFAHAGAAYGALAGAEATEPGVLFAMASPGFVEARMERAMRKMATRRR